MTIDSDFLVNDRSNRALITPYENQQNLDWFLMTALSPEYFNEQIQENRNNTIVLCLLTALITCTIALLIVRAICQPVTELTVASENIVSENPLELKLLNENYWIKELKNISQSFNLLIGKLQESSQVEGKLVQLELEKDNLTEDISSLTQDLTKKEKYRSIYQHMAIGIAYANQKEQFIDVNDKICEMLGYTAEELKQKTISEITYHEDKKIHLAPIRQLINGEIGYFVLRKRYVTKDGNVIWFKVTASLNNQEKKDSDIIIALEDITQEKDITQE